MDGQGRAEKFLEGMVVDKGEGCVKIYQKFRFSVFQKFR